MRIAGLTDHQAGVKLIEEEFELEWLQEQAAQDKDVHPIAKQWKETRAALNEYTQTGTFNISGQILSLTSFAEDLRLARSLANYKSVIFPRLKGSEFTKVQYEIYVSALCVRAKFPTQFIAPSQNGRTADLLLDWDGTHIHVECTRRDPYIPLAPDYQGPTTTLLDAVRSQNLAGLEVIVIVLSALENKDILAIVRDIHQIDQNAGSYSLRRPGYGVYVQKLPPPEGDGHWLVAFGSKPPFTLEAGIFIPAGQNPAWAQATCGVDERGRKFLKDHYRVYLHTISSHDLQTVVETFGRKRRQIPKGGPGIIFVDLDVSHVAVRDIPLYLDLVAEGLKGCFSPNINTRVWAIVLTTIPVPVQTGERDNKFIILRRGIKVVRNQYATIPSHFAVPGENVGSESA